MLPTQSYEEINAYVVGWGFFFAVLFALAAGYLCLKIGQTVDAFAPVSAKRLAEGNTVASGFVAGGAIGSLISAVLHIACIDWIQKAWAVSPAGTYLGIFAYFALCVFLFWMAKRAVRE